MEPGPSPGSAIGRDFLYTFPPTVFFFPRIFAPAPFQLMALAEIVFLRPNLETELLTQHFSLGFLEG